MAIFSKTSDNENICPHVKDHVMTIPSVLYKLLIWSFLSKFFLCSQDRYRQGHNKVITHPDPTVVRLLSGPKDPNRKSRSAMTSSPLHNLCSTQVLFICPNCIIIVWYYLTACVVISIAYSLIMVYSKICSNHSSKELTVSIYYKDLQHCILPDYGLQPFLQLECNYKDL